MVFDREMFVMFFLKHIFIQLCKETANNYVQDVLFFPIHTLNKKMNQLYLSYYVSLRSEFSVVMSVTISA